MKKFLDYNRALVLEQPRTHKHLIAKCNGFSLSIHRPAVLLLTIVALTVTQSIWAEHVTPEKALWLARDFMQQRVESGNRPRKAQGTLELKPAQQVSGLYIFNVADDGGFVIVSNDDRSIPVLGFSDSGRIDPDNMPDNMRAWLQGYADEIKWLSEAIPFSSSQGGSAKAPHRVGNHPQTAIGPLVSTTWDQAEPYYNFCPMDGGLRSLTGCIATAMAQVMKYHEWPTATTVEIPEYDCATLGKTLEALPATTFDWSNMLDDYSGKYNATQASAVAKLMQYCGWSVQMMYTSGLSYSYTTSAVNALTTYFDYNSTVQYVGRSSYTYANWTDLIYHELREQRPVIYCGVSNLGGHGFICDGYKYEGSTDLFHINWGWGGKCDGYFVLSVMDPDYQGSVVVTYGSFYTGQEAVIGIQKPSDKGSVLDVKVNENDILPNSGTLSSSNITLGESVDITLNITNNSDDPYDGELAVVATLNGNMYIAAGDMFLIPPKTTQDCVIRYTPASSGVYTMGFAFPKGDGFYHGSEDFIGKLVVVGANISLLDDDRLSATKNTSLIDTWNLNLVNATLSGRTLLKNGSWNTLCVPFNVPIENSPLAGATVKKLTASTSGVSGATLTLNFEDETTTIIAGTPYLIKWDSGEDLINPTFYGVTISNMVRPAKTSDHAVTFKGTYKPISFTEEDQSILFLGTGNTLYYPQPSTNINSFRSYFSIDTSASIKEYKLNFGEGEEDADGIVGLTPDPSPVGEGSIYNLAGQRIQKTQRGIYIVNGKKVLK